MNTFSIAFILVGIAVLGIAVVLVRGNTVEFALPSGPSVSFSRDNPVSGEAGGHATSSSVTESANKAPSTSTRKIVVAQDGTKHSIPLDEILSGGPGKDGIPSIDTPRFLAASKALYLNDDDPGIGISVDGESRFYPYRILVWHEIVNDTIAGAPILVTYCPLCATGIVFDRTVNGTEEEFGVSGRLWQSNLLMYNRAEDSDNESLWSQVLGEAVVGVHTGERLTVLPSSISRWGEWRAAHPETLALSEDTGAVRDYGRDPYGGYYTSESVSFGATFRDTRLHPKALVYGIEIGGAYKAYPESVIDSGTIHDTFAGTALVVTKDNDGAVRITAGDALVPSVPAFWFSWIAVHPDTELYQ